MGLNFVSFGDVTVSHRDHMHNGTCELHVTSENMKYCRKSGLAVFIGSMRYFPLETLLRKISPHRENLKTGTNTYFWP